MTNADEARTAVFELFQDLDGFSLDDYQPLSDNKSGMDEIVEFVQAVATEENQRLNQESENIFTLEIDQGTIRFTTDRDTSLTQENVELLGLDHPLIVQYMQQFRSLPPGEVGIRVSTAGASNSQINKTGVLSIWHVSTEGDRGRTTNAVIPLALDNDNNRIPAWEKQVDAIFALPPATGPSSSYNTITPTAFEPVLQRDLTHRGILAEKRGYTARLIGWIEVV